MQHNPKSNTKLNANLNFNSNRKTNLNPKTNPNLNLQKTEKTWNFWSYNIHRKGENAVKNKTNTVPNPTANPNPNPTIDEAGKRKGTE